MHNRSFTADGYVSFGPYYRTIAQGAWFHLNLPRDCTPDELAQFLSENRIAVTPEDISMKDFATHRAATIRIPYETLCTWLDWIVSETPFRGEQLLKFRLHNPRAK